VMRERFEKLGMSLEEALPQTASSRKPRSDIGKPLPVRYRGPNGETWSARGRKPYWLVALEALGHNAEEFRVAED
jgi:DNA-binding protein H-NS